MTNTIDRKSPTVQLTDEIAVSPRLYRLVHRLARRQSGGDVEWFLKGIKDVITFDAEENKRINLKESKEQGLSVIQYLQSGSFLERASEKNMSPDEYYEYEKSEMLRITGLSWS